MRGLSKRFGRTQERRCWGGRAPRSGAAERTSKGILRGSGAHEEGPPGDGPGIVRNWSATSAARLHGVGLTTKSFDFVTPFALALIAGLLVTNTGFVMTSNGAVCAC